MWQTQVRVDGPTPEMGLLGDVDMALPFLASAVRRYRLNSGSDSMRDRLLLAGDCPATERR
jgi:hypothetical protein